MIDEIAEWSGDTSALVTLCLTLTSAVAFVVSGVLNTRTAADGRSSPYTLIFSGWRMSTPMILRQWEAAGQKVPKTARRTYWADLVAAVTLGATLLISAATVGKDESVELIRDTRDVAAWAAIVGAVAAVVVNVSMVHIVRVYRKDATVDWLAVSIAMTIMWARIIPTLVAAIYVLVAAAST